MFLRSLRVGWFLTLRYLRRGSRWASLLIVAIMFLTFLNVVVVRGVLVGLPIGASISYEREYSGQVLVTPLSNQRHIDRTTYVEQLVSATPGYRDHSARYLATGVVRADYARPQKASLLPDQVGATLAGIDPASEDRVTSLSNLVVEGRYLEENDTNAILIGSQLLERYAGDVPESGGTPETSGSIAGVFAGDTVRLTIGDVVGEYTVVGVVEGKVGENSRRIFMVDRHLRKVLGRGIDKKDELAIALVPDTPGEDFVRSLRQAGLTEFATIQTANESQGKFLDDITDTFDLLGNGVGLIGIIVAAITVFIMIFIVALNRQKQIGILKGIGINRLTIESSYVFLSIAYAFVGIGLGVLVLYGIIAPYVAQHPIDFPFADGILVAPWNDTLARALILVGTTLIAGYLPARIIVQKHTIDAILGR
ncbi:MAG: ABC transporter permease [Candidatus Pacebacteria bacterium]|nr:ABC transporter permease [Candidatus Paceibacterota bacterium]